MSEDFKARLRNISDEVTGEMSAKLGFSKDVFSGPRLVESLRILAEVIHRKLFDSHFDGIGWRRI